MAVHVQTRTYQQPVAVTDQFPFQHNTINGKRTFKMKPKSRAVLSAVTLLAALTVSAAQQTSLPPTGTQSKAAVSGYAKLPLAFEANRGQTDPSVKFLSRGTGYSVFLTGGGMVLALRPEESVIAAVASGTTSNGASKLQPTSKSATNKSVDTTMIFNLVGAASNPTVVGEDPLPTKVNYFIGKDPKKWQTNVQT
jgi:hypothetical protein